MEKKALLIPIIAIIAIGVMTCIRLAQGIDGEVLYFSIVAVSAIAGVSINKAVSKAG